jgi:hypothetical protein
LLLPSRTSCVGTRLSECWHGLLRPPHQERPGLARAGGVGSFIYDTGGCACTRSCAGTPVFIYTGLSAHCCIATLFECGISVTLCLHAGCCVYIRDVVCVIFSCTSTMFLCTRFVSRARRRETSKRGSKGLDPFQRAGYIPAPSVGRRMGLP